MEFLDLSESSAHLELLRLRSQAYSSLYGYAGGAISPQAQINLFDFSLHDRLSSSHVDKIWDFRTGLLDWQRNLTPTLKVAYADQTTIADANHVQSNLALMYNQVRRRKDLSCSWRIPETKTCGSRLLQSAHTI